jgi:hypothetical protein
MKKWIRRKRTWAALVLLLIAAGGLFFATSNHPAIWPLRNTVAYRVTNWWHEQVGTTPPAGEGTLSGCVSSAAGEQVTAATVLVAERDGTTHTAATGADGCYTIADIPAGSYVPVAGAPGYASTTAHAAWGRSVRIPASGQRTLDITLEPATPPEVAPGTNLRISAPVTLSWDVPQPGRAIRRELTYSSGGEPNQPTWLYTPETGSSSGPYPTLLAVYPGPADTWESVSIPLAAAGYAVIAVGPEYALTLDDDIDELQRLLMFARAGDLPDTDGSRVAALGGSYSGLHVLRLLRREVGLQSAVLLGPPSDLFDYRRRFEQGSFFPPYGLDQALIALGTPDTAPMRYWRNSARYHIEPDWPPILLMHSRQDEIVPFEQSQVFVEDLEQAGVDVESYFFTGMRHYLRADQPSEELDRLYTITLDFLARTLRSPASAE